MKFDQDLCLNLQYDFGKMNSTLGSVVPLAMFFSSARYLTVANHCGLVAGILEGVPHSNSGQRDNISG